MTSFVSTPNTKSIIAAIEQLRSHCQVDIQNTWRYSEVDFPPDEVFASDISTWELAILNEKAHIPRDKGRKVLWLAQTIVVSKNLHSCYPLQDLSLRLALIWWADTAQVYVNGKLAAAGDLFDFSPRVLLSHAVTPGNKFTVAVRLITPAHDNGALMRSHLLYENTNNNSLDAGFIADEIAVIQKYLETFAPENLPILASSVEEITNHTTTENPELFKKVLANLSKIPQNWENTKIFLLGHAHLDMAWLWQVEETWKAAQNTFESVLNLQEDFPELTFCHSTPALYEWIEKNRPDLFTKIQAKVKTGKWEVLGGFWIEPDLNLISGESIVRQLLYGQRYTQEKFGIISPIIWVPDTFGFCWTLPQLMQQAGIEYFVTQKLRWNDTNKFPHGAFWWQSPDGSQIFSYMSALIGEGIDPLKMAAYACEWQTQTHIPDALWLPGVGDHGGGPTRDMLEIAQRWQKSQFFPELEFTTAENYLRHIQKIGEWVIEKQEETEIEELNNLSSPPSPSYRRPGGSSLPSSPSSQFPTWNDELYLEFHRGCFTTHGEQKSLNRKCENLLYEAELFATWAKIASNLEYPHSELEKCWKKLLFNQFHDILPGSSITEVYTDTLPEWQEIQTIGTRILQDSLNAIIPKRLPKPPHPDAKPIFIFNSLNWQRSQVVIIDLPNQTTNPCIFTTDGKIIPSQISKPSKLLFLAENIPAIGYKIFWLCLNNSENPNRVAQDNDSILFSKNQITLTPEKIAIENEFLRVIVDEKTGDLTSIFDLINNKEILNGKGNQLQAFTDSGQYWDAWNIDPNYAQHPLPFSELKSIEFLEQGQIQTSLRVIRQIERSQFQQDYILVTNSPLLKIVTKVDWQERHIIVKAAFPLTIESGFATYEIPCGAIPRTTKPQTPEEKAKWEVPALRWADLTQNGEWENGKENNHQKYGVSLLNDCKYGYDATPNQLRLTLLRGTEYPDSEADKGIHEFTYALYPHAGSWEEAQTVRRGYELNLPLQVLNCENWENTEKNSKQSQPDGNIAIAINSIEKPNPIQDSFSLLNLSAENVILMAFKPAEDDPEAIIIRCYECQGKTAEMHLHSDFGYTLETQVDLLERPIPTPSFSSNQQNFTIQPWKVVSFKMRRHKG
ncbi:alpha-mannosidase [Brunnivagina elsteri]|uniref:Alpha-mannosidase n=1 Tax=Brunnivagina elsteri CCALA 953 TaxID=987040 RepID=A0A2A2TPE9_9CYAN|nr:alpha-mannosidase [Calothrix elsteri]PAX60406.1 alpha-mannosidase [Calothrix elsteri CCALA 953]